MKYTGIAIALIASAPLSAPLSAAHLSQCHPDIAHVQNVAWDDPTRSYANGRVRLVRIDTGAPACCAFYLVVLRYETGSEDVACTLVSQTEGYGWAQMSLEEARSEYRPGAGLRVFVPVAQDGAEGPKPGTLVLNVNQATGGLSVE